MNEWMNEYMCDLVPSTLSQRAFPCANVYSSLIMSIRKLCELIMRIMLLDTRGGGRSITTTFRLENQVLEQTLPRLSEWMSKTWAGMTVRFLGTY